MTDPQDLDDLDRAARSAAGGLRAHVDRTLDVEQGLARLPVDAPANRRARLLVAAAVGVLVVGGLAIAGSHGGGVRTDDDQRQLLPPPEALSPLGPTDGNASMGLPVEVVPATELVDHQRVLASGSGFVPGQAVGIVQCARESGPPSAGGTSSGIDACNSGRYTPVTAAADGTASGSFVVDRFLTTPITGTIDCAGAADRCLVAIGAISDYDRSGGHAISFVEGSPGDAPAIPTLEVTPADGLRDRDEVHVRGTGYQPGSIVFLQVCAGDPLACWTTGETIEDQGAIGLAVDDQGRIRGDVPVWQFLPASEPGRYADCAVSQCALRIQSAGGPTAPPPVPLAFRAGGNPPTAAVLAVDPDRGVHAGDSVDLIADGLAPGSHVIFVFCLNPGPDGSTGPEAADSVCTTMGDREVDGDGSIVTSADLPDPASLSQGCDGCAQAPTTTACGGDGCSAATPDVPQAPAGGTLCDGVTTHCTISLQSGMASNELSPPFFLPAPVAIRFAPT